MVKIRASKGVEAALKQYADKITKAKKLKVGFLKGADYPDGTPVALVAAVQNFGSPKMGIPPRPFFTNMVKAKGPGWPAALGKILEANDFDSQKALELMGEGIRNQLEQSIIDTMEPALSPITLMLRKMKSEDQSLKVTGATVGEAARRLDAGESVGDVSTKPLEDTKHMLNSTGFEVE